MSFFSRFKQIFVTGDAAIGGDAAVVGVVSAGSVDSSADVNAHNGFAAQVKIGDVGPSGEAGIALGIAGDTVWYRAGGSFFKTADDVQIDGQLVANGEFAFRKNLIGHTNSTGAVSYNLLATDTTVLVDSTTNAVTVNLTASIAQGRIIIVKDETGNASANNITIATDDAATIDGDPTVTIASDYGSVILQKGSGTNLSIIGSHLP